MLALGTPIVYTHQAAIARKAGKDQYVAQGEWFVPSKGNGRIHGSVLPDKTWGPTDEYPFRFIDAKGNELTFAEVEKYNRVLIAWKQAGSGVITGLMRKLYGVTEGSRFSNGPYGEDYEQGYLATYGAVDLYTVRWELKGSDFVYVPTWAAKPMIPQEA